MHVYKIYNLMMCTIPLYYCSLWYIITDGVEAPPVLNMCLRYQQHLSEVACVIANAQVSIEHIM